MSKIENIDKNFKVETKINKPDIEFHNARSAPFVINGVYYEDGKFRRMPESVAKTVSNGVHYLHANTAGGRVRFKTTSPYVAISAKLSKTEIAARAKKAKKWSPRIKGGWLERYAHFVGNASTGASLKP